MHFPILNVQVVKKLQTMYGNLYTDDNVILSGTHTHSGPAGYFQYVLFEITSMGFVKENLDVVVNGVVKSISIGEPTLQHTRLYVRMCTRAHIQYTQYICRAEHSLLSTIIHYKGRKWSH